ncbi:Copper homeostasis protein CutC [Bacteroides pyogenes]|uniref:copper homeostasis protein CutC n=1 Tax=Bacteroides pyogenes TaxID=310300 RepID=UPI001BAC516E|nr:copper homeostasis protein CutC [Bacteroides pyogenes]MBR8720353.1 Copper homeostasis protein CutC [Bacteroides pyogenes]MBR8724841.1 Copper homeostasis protein CutC [Bacteroides pyogenes]MBR8738380.1 Copper homeostasis protein CutC [Bacteroides pyogenes]MBR8754053.1 Copper homeostasis protein CutC [Bacteroides pyogenes]MBR8785997.1 Copper homeostasis protein CutC [Bacteroides pyogenes]
MKKYQFEICANSVESCLAAQAGGAHRVELCAGIPEGGTTPSYGEISVARELLTHTRLHVIIRPRGGDFLYSPIEVRTMLKDIEAAHRLKADGVVFGCLTADGEIDLSVMRELMHASKGMSVTFHRAFDVCRNPQKAMEEIIELGCHRILTSGQQPSAEKGIPLLREMQQQAAGRIILLAGCGVNEGNIARIAKETGIQEFHFSARESVRSPMTYKNESVSMGGTIHIDEYERTSTTVKRVRETIHALHSIVGNKK